MRIDEIYDYFRTHSFNEEIKDFREEWMQLLSLYNYLFGNLIVVVC
jgi:hypothetical protein